MRAYYRDVTSTSGQVRAGQSERASLRRLLRYVRPYGWRLAGAFVLLFLSSALAVAGPAIIAIAIDVYVAPAAGASGPVGSSARVGEWLRTHGVALDPLRGVAFAAAVYLLVLALEYVVLRTQMMLMSMTGQRVMFDLRQEIFEHLQQLDIAFFDRTPIGQLMTRVTYDVEALDDLFSSGVVTVLRDVFVLAGIVTVLFWMNWRLALVLFSVSPLLLVAARWFRQAARSSYRDIRLFIASLNAFLQEHISGMSTVQLFNREEREAANFDGVNAGHRDAAIRAIFPYAVFYPLIEIIETAGLALVVWYGGGMVIQGTLSIGSLMAFFQYSQRFYQPVGDLADKYNLLHAAMAASERIFEILDAKPEIGNGGTREIDTFESLELRGVWFAYEAEQWVLKDVSFRVERGQRVALVGHTGAGKTTVTALLLRFYDPQRGQILVNGTDIREYRLDSLRQLFATVAQDPFLFSGTIAENLSFGAPRLTPAAREGVAARVGADRFIARLPDGYDARIGERGTGLSVGEKQLLALARAMAADPAVLVLDEATSSVDAATEAAIEAATRAVLAGRTSIVIAHRLATVRSADVILVFHRGELRERGAHQELMQQRGIYARLVRLRYGGDALT